MEIPASQDAKTHLIEMLSTALSTVAPGSTVSIVLERPKQTAHGDYACNIALQLAKALRAKPRDIAQRLVAALPASAMVEKAEIAGAGFINLFLKRSYKQQIVNRVLMGGADFGKSTLGSNKRVQVEFVSANPTGPLH